MSCTHAYLLLKGYAPSSMSTVPPSEGCSQIASTSPMVLQRTWKDTEGLKMSDAETRRRYFHVSVSLSIDSHPSLPNSRWHS